jgi:aminopeptidase
MVRSPLRTPVVRRGTTSWEDYELDERLVRFARVLVNYSLSVEPGQSVALRATPVAAPLLLAVVHEVVRAGGYPVPMLSLPGADEILLKYGNDQQLSWISPVQRFGVEGADVTISILSETNTRALSGVDPSRQQLAQAARRDLTQTMMQRSANGELEWCVTLYPTDAYAQDADMSLADYTEFVYSACHLDDDDPVSHWRAVSAEQARMIAWLSSKQEIHVVGADTDVRVGVAGRGWMNADGKRNLPDGEIFTGPVETAVDGVVRFSFPSQVQGREVEDIRLWFEAGQVVKATAAKNQDYLERMLEIDEGARRLGEFAIGTNYGITAFSKNILFDEKIGGTMHMALGAGYPETGSRNESAIHWDMICDLRQGSTITADGELFAQDGTIIV